MLERPPDAFYQSEPPRNLAPLSAVRQELARFIRLGMLREERPEGQNRVWYVVTDSDLWEVIRCAREVVGQPSGECQSPVPARRLLTGTCPT